MLGILAAGVLIWSLVHLFPALMPAKRTQLINSLGEGKYKGVFALLVLIGLALIIVGWRNTVPTHVYSPPSFGRHLTMLLMLFSVILFGAAKGKNWITQRTRHPMLIGMTTWGVAHLIANGDIRAVVLFGGMTIWAIVSILLINKREGAWARPAAISTGKANLRLIVISVVVYAVLIFLHPYFAGVPLIR